jgi:hypothetical protein
MIIDDKISASDFICIEDAVEPLSLINDVADEYIKIEEKTRDSDSEESIEEVIRPTVKIHEAILVFKNIIVSFSKHQLFQTKKP